MKETSIALLAAIAFCVPAWASAEMAPAGTDRDDSLKLEHYCGMPLNGEVVHEEIVKGIMTTFRAKDISANLKKIGVEETHHITASFIDVKSGKRLSQGEVTMEVIAPDNTSQVKDLRATGDSFGADFVMPAPGRYDIIAKFRVADGHTRVVTFWYNV